MIKNILLILGAVLLLIGVIGFFNDPVLGIFEVDTLHNIIHLVTGILLLMVAVKGELTKMKLWAKTLGVIYGLVAIIGLVIAGEKWLGLFENNRADDILHVALALILLWIGFAGAKSTADITDQGQADKQGDSSLSVDQSSEQSAPTEPTPGQEEETARKTADAEIQSSSKTTSV